MSELLWETFGILFIFSVGTLLHFTYDALGKWKPVGLIAPVNESVWEHLKMGFWPTLIYGIIEFFLFALFHPPYGLGKGFCYSDDFRLFNSISLRLQILFKETCGIVGHPVFFYWLLPSGKGAAGMY